MRTSLNLSSRPFRNHRLYWLAIFAVFSLSVWLGLWVSAETSRVRAKAGEVEASIRAQASEVKRYSEEQERLKAESEKIVLSEQDSIELASARQLIASRALSWNRLITDIERFVPKHAKVTAIQVFGASTSQGRVAAQVEIKALGQESGQLTEMMESLEKSDGLFEVRSFGQEATSETGEVPFTLRVTYAPARGEA